MKAGTKGMQAREKKFLQLQVMKKSIKNVVSLLYC